MQIKHYIYISLCFIFLFFLPFSNQAQTELLKKALYSAGFENIRIEKENEKLFVAVEDNIYRFAPTGVMVLMDSINHYFLGKPVNLILLKNGLPDMQIQFQVTGQETGYKLKQIDVSYKINNSWALLQHIIPENSTRYKTDIVVYPQVAIQNRLLNKLYEGQFNLAPAVETSLWKGMKFTGQLIIPLYNSLDAAGDDIRTGFVTLSQEYRFRSPWFGKISAGLFNAYRYGIDLQLRRPFGNGNWNFNLQSGYTGNSQIINGKWQKSPLNTFTWFSSLSHYYAPLNMQLAFGGGRFLNNDYGVKIDVTRYLGESSISFFALYGEGPFNGGFRFSVPIVPRKSKRTQSIRVRPARYFDLEYNYEAQPQYFNYYESAPGINDTENRFYPLWLKNYILNNYHYEEQLPRI